MIIVLIDMPPSVHHRTGGLEKSISGILSKHTVHHRTGGLEIIQ